MQLFSADAKQRFFLIKYFFAPEIIGLKSAQISYFSMKMTPCATSM